MAGMHFIILKVNGVDVSQMPHEKAVQMFLKASEPILVEVRRRSYDSDDSAECIDKKNLPNDTPNVRRQSPTVSQLTSPARSQKLPNDSTAAVDSLKFNSLIISSSQSCIGLDSTTKQRGAEQYVNSSASLPIATSRNNNNSASEFSQHYLSLNNQASNVSESSSCNVINSQSRCASVSSAAASPTKSIQQKSANSSPFKEFKTQDDEVQRSPSKKLVSIGVQTDNFTTDFIFSGSTILNSDQMIENEHNLFSECMAPEIDIEEITLRKSESNERLGLTVCYSSGGGNGSGSDDTDTCTEVYISDIVPDSIAGRDGRLRQGDQILQVNGKDVSNKEETETLIAENNNAVTLLVSRYLYGDDDEFNEQGDFFEEDDPDMAYANCFLGNYIISEDPSKSAKSSHDTSPEKKPLAEDSEPNDRPTPEVDLPTKTPAQASARDPFNHQNIRAHLEQVNQEIAMLDSRVENMMLQHTKPSKLTDTSAAEQKIPQATVAPNLAQLMDYDTEHIYETIPEDSESEPFYCSPYESSEHQTRIEQWLGIQEGPEMHASKVRSLPIRQPIMQQNHENLSIWTKAKNGTVRSTNSSVGDDHENSSSAYNTGGSCNSNTMTPLTLELNSSSRDREHHSASTLILYPSKHTVSPINEVATPQRLSISASGPELIDSAKSLHRHSKEKILSPTHISKQPQVAFNKQKILTSLQKNAGDSSAVPNSQTTPISASNTMYTNVANLQQTMLLQQQLFRQALTHQRVPSSLLPCPQFTAPNLSQYHFVSSQEVSTVKLNTHLNDEHMVWKVKRRQDGTRYIVRRPARNRFLRNRAMRISAERNDQTTEDDTISEIKTGRYWTKEERKKHIERARERRQRQQIIISSKNNEVSPSNNGCSKNVEATQKTLNEKLQANPELYQQQAKVSNILAATSAKMYRQNPLTGQTFSKKFVKKATNGSPVEVSPATVPQSNTSTPAPAGTTKPTSTTPSGGSKMLQGVSDTSYHGRGIHP